jgi:hypothetical protein
MWRANQSITHDNRHCHGQVTAVGYAQRLIRKKKPGSERLGGVLIQALEPGKFGEQLAKRFIPLGNLHLHSHPYIVLRHSSRAAVHASDHIRGHTLYKVEKYLQGFLVFDCGAVGYLINHLFPP